MLQHKLQSSMSDVLPLTAPQQHCIISRHNNLYFMIFHVFFMVVILQEQICCFYTQQRNRIENLLWNQATDTVSCHCYGWLGTPISNVQMQFMKHFRFIASFLVMIRCNKWHWRKTIKPHSEMHQLHIFQNLVSCLLCVYLKRCREKVCVLFIQELYFTSKERIPCEQPASKIK